MQSKPWLTSASWPEQVCICTQEQVADIEHTWPEVIHPEWDASFKNSALTWIGKLRALLEQAGRNADGLDNCVAILQQTAPEYMPSERSLAQKIARLRRGSHPQAIGSATAAASGLEAAIAAAFPGSHCGGVIVLSSRSQEGQLGFCDEPTQDGMYCIFLSNSATAHFSAAQCPVRLGRVLRVVAEAAEPYVVVQSYWPLIKKDKYPGRCNLFGTWLPGLHPVVLPSPSKKAKPADGTLTVTLSHVILWPIDPEPRSNVENGLRIPLQAFHALRNTRNIDTSLPEFAFAPRGKTFYMETVKEAARWAYEQRTGEPF